MSEAHVAVPGACLRVQAIGRGPPIVVLHGGPDFDHRYLRPELDLLAQSFRVIYYDQRGRGESTGEAADVTIESEVEDLECLRRHFALDSPVLLGHSWGAVLAMEYAARHPGHVGGLVLMNAPAASRAGFERLAAHRNTVEPGTLERMREIASSAMYAAGNIDLEGRYLRLHYGSTLPDPALRDRLVARLRLGAAPRDVVRAREIEQRLYAGTWQRREAYDLVPRLRALDVPTLVLHAERDFVPLECVRPIAEAIPGARLVVLEGCGHFAYMERPQAVFEAIEGFLREG